MSRLPEMIAPAIACAALLTGLPAPVQAQQGAKPPAAAAAPAPDQQQRAPVIQFPAQGLTLDDAVKLTLQHDPALKRSQANVRFAEGVAQQFGGAFDYTLRGNAEYTHRAQELSEGAKRGERERRDSLQRFLDENSVFREEARRLQPLVDQLRNAPPGGLPVDSIATINPSMATTIAALDQLILSTADATERSRLLTVRNDFLTQASSDLKKEIDAIELDFTETETQLRNLGFVPLDEIFVDALATVRLDKLFRSGISVSPFVDATFGATNYRNKPRPADFGGKDFPDQLRFNAGVDFGAALLRGRGTVGTAAPERAARLDLEASRLALDHQAAARALATIEAYWSLRAAQDVVQIAELSLKFQDQVLGATRQSIAAQQVAAIEEARALAARSRVQAELEDAHRRLLDARIALADVMGIAVSADPASLPTAADPFPQNLPDPASLVGLVDQAVSRRLDLSAAIKGTEAGDVVLAGARRNLASRLDVSGAVFFTALGEGKGGETLDRWVGPSGRIALDYEKPLGNNTQKGQFAQAEAAASQRRIAQFDLERQIRLGVVEAAGSLQQAAARVAQAQAAVGHYERTIESMMRLLGAGNARLIDALTTEQQQITAQLAVVSAQLELAQRLARLRYESGSLLVGGTLTSREDVPARRRN